MVTAHDALFIAFGVLELAVAAIALFGVVRMFRRADSVRRMVTQRLFFALAFVASLSEGLSLVAFRVPRCGSANGWHYSLQTLPGLVASFLFLSSFAVLAAFLSKAFSSLSRRSSDSAARYSGAPDKAAAATAMLFLLIVLLFLGCGILIFSVKDSRQCQVVRGVAIICALLLLLISSIATWSGVRAHQLGLWKVMHHRSGKLTVPSVVCSMAAVVAVRVVFVFVLEFAVHDSDLIPDSPAGIVFHVLLDLIPQALAIWLMWPFYLRGPDSGGSNGSTPREANAPLANDSMAINSSVDADDGIDRPLMTADQMVKGAANAAEEQYTTM